jgi:histidinol dehydrogenase
VTDSHQLARAVQIELEKQVPNQANRERIMAALSGQQSAIAVVSNFADAISVANEYATEHLEIHTADDEAVLSQISNAGAIFMGEFSPVSLGDYIAGSNHVLPTSEQAKFGPGLGVHSFLRPQQVIRYDRGGLLEVTDQLVDFANAEGLSAHGAAASIRFGKES